MKKNMLSLSFFTAFILMNINVFAQSSGIGIVNGGGGQGLLTNVPGMDCNNCQYINKSISGFWRMRILPVRVSPVSQDFVVNIEYGIDKPGKIRGLNAQGGENLYDLSEFENQLQGVSIDFEIVSEMTTPGNGPKETYVTKFKADKYGEHSVKTALLTFRATALLDSLYRMRAKYQGEDIDPSDFQSKFKFRVASITAKSGSAYDYSLIDKELGRKLESVKTDTEFQRLVREGQNSEAAGNIDNAIMRYEEALAIKDDPQVRQGVVALKEQKQKNSTNLSNQNSAAHASATLSATTTTTTTNTTTFAGRAQANRQQAEADRNAAYRQQQQQQRDREAARRDERERAEAEKRREVEARNNALLQQGNDIYRQSLRTEYAIDAAAEKLKVLFDTPTKSAAQIRADAEAEAEEDARWEREQRRIEREERRIEREKMLERERLQREREEAQRIAAEKAKLESDRRAIFAQYTGGALPTSATFTNSNNLFYFVYGYGRLDDYNSEMYVSNIFAIGQYPDKTWPMYTTVQQEIDNLTAFTEVVHGSFTSDRQAQTALLTFKNALLTTGMQINDIFYAGKNAHAFTIIDEGPALDAWGNPVKEDAAAGTKKVKLDEWGNPVKTDSSKVKLDVWGNPIKKKGNNEG